MICSTFFDLVNPMLKYILLPKDNLTVCFPEWFLNVIEFYKSGEITLQEFMNIILFLFNSNLFSIS